MNVTFAYPVRFERAEEGGWVISSRDLPELWSQAEDDEDRVEVAEGALQAAFEYRIMKKEPLPQPSKPRTNEQLVTVPVETATKAALHMVVAEEKVTKTELAKRLALDEKEVRRLMDPQHASKVPRIAQALAAYGKRIQISIVPASSRAASRASKVLDVGKPMAAKRDARQGTGGRQSTKK